MLSQFDKSLPLKSSIASEGGAPALVCVLAVPGVITGGNGRVRSLGFHGLEGVHCSHMSCWAISGAFDGRVTAMRVISIATISKLEAMSIVLRMVDAPFRRTRLGRFWAKRKIGVKECGSGFEPVTVENPRAVGQVMLG